MSVRQGAAKRLLRLMAGARRLGPVRMLYAMLPRNWKLGITRALLRNAIGADGMEMPLAKNAPRVINREMRACTDPRYAGNGVNLYGHVRGEFGLGESVRRFARALADCGYPFSLIDFAATIPAQAEDHSLDAWLVKQPEYACSIYFVNPDQMLSARAHFEARKRAGSRVIGYWFWELAQFPDEWRDAFQLVDEIWVASEFVRNSVAAATNKPVMLMPMPMDCTPSAGVDRQRFGLPNDRFLFLFTFDYHSYPRRKNPEAVIAAFRDAFPLDRQDVGLVVKTINADRVPDAHLQLLEKAKGDPRIIIRDGHLARTDVSALIACADVYISLHRSEGLGLGMIEAMALGKPVIATAWSGNMDFMSDQEACLIDCRLVEVAPSAYLHWQGQQWAEPDLSQAAQCMRRLADSPDAAKALGAAAAARIRRQYAPPACALAAIHRLQAIRPTRAC